MEDLAAIAVRDMATPVGDLATRFDEYEAAGGPAVDRAAVEWYRILVLVRNSMLIGLGLGFDYAATDRAELTMYRTTLMRAAALALCDAVGVERPDEAPFEASDPSDELMLVAHVWRDQRGRSLRPSPTASPVGGLPGWRGSWAWSTIGSATARTGRTASWSSSPPCSAGGRESVAAGLAQLDALAADAGREREVVTYLARHLVRESMLLEPLLGELADRHPQRLELR